MEDETRYKNLREQGDFVMSFVDDSAKTRKDLDDVWDEVEQNFLVRPYQDTNLMHDTRYPLHDRLDTQSTGRAVLKDPETHQEIMTIVSNIVLGVMPEPGYVRAKMVGGEDVYKAKIVDDLIEYTDRLPGAFTANVEWIMAACIYGTGVKELFWDYQEQPRKFRSVGVDPLTGEETTESATFMAPVYDDVREEVFDVRDFFPDPGNNRIDRMLGAARRFKITAREMRARADDGIYKRVAVERAIARRATKDAKENEQKPGADELDMSGVRESHPDFIKETGYRYVGTVPWNSRDGFQHREIVVIGGETVRSRPWPRRIPWFDVKITPRLNSFWGIGPGEINRYDQDFADIVKMMLADAVVRLVHPPHVYDKNAQVDLAKLRAYKPQVPIGVQGDPNRAIGQPNYNPQLQPAFAMYQGIKQQMREGTGALDALQGLGLGTNRKSASEAVGTFEYAAQRPELFGAIVEREYLPPCAKYKLELNQEYLEDTEDLRRRIGATNTAAVLGDIMPEFDIEYVGSRMAGTRNDDLAAMREIISMGANPALFPMLPWIPMLQMFLEKRGAHEIAAMVGNPDLIKFHMMLQNFTGTNPQAGNNNGTVPSNPPSGLLPAQVMGGIS